MTIVTAHRSGSHAHRARRFGALVTIVAIGLAAAACSSGESALQSGNDPTPTTTPATGAPLDTDGDVDDSTPTAPSTTASPSTTTTTPLSSLPPCPVDALESVNEPVEIVFWHAMSNEPEEALVALTDEYNASQDRVRVRLENQIGYDQTTDKYIQSSSESRPNLVQLPEYTIQMMADSDTIVPIDACLEASGLDTSVFLARVLDAWSAGGVRWAMPFNISNPVLYSLRPRLEAAGLDPDPDAPLSLDELRQASQAIVDSGAATYGIALDTGSASGGGWFVEQWFAKAGELYADNGNGRLGPATQVLYDGPTGVELLTFLQQMIADGLAVNVGDNPGGQDTFLKLADPASPAAMTIGTSAGLGTVLAALDGGLVPGIASDDVGVSPMPGPDGAPGVLVGGAALHIVAGKSDAATAAAWDYVQFLVGAQSQSTWAAATNYVPVRADAIDLEPLATRYRDDPRFAVAYEQLLASPEGPAALGPVLGPQREVRTVTARAVAEIFAGSDVADALTRAAAQSDALIADYAARN